MRLGREMDDVISRLHEVVNWLAVADVASDKPVALVTVYVAKVRWVPGIRELIQIDDAGISVFS